MRKKPFPPAAMLRMAAIFLFPLVVLLHAGAARAQSCWSSGYAPLHFGAVEVDRATDSQTSVTLTCNSGEQRYLRYCVFMPGSFPRTLSGDKSKQLLQYTLYSDPARTQPIGPPPSGGAYPLYTGTAIIPASWSQLATTIWIYGRVPAGQAVPNDTFRAHLKDAIIRWVMSRTDYPASCAGGEDEDFDLGVTATAASGCRISVATDLDFGTASQVTDNVDQTSTITLRCPNGTPWFLGLDNGQHAAGTVRRMRSAAGDYVTYELYRNSARTQRWGNTGAERLSGTGIGELTPQVQTVHGRVPPQAANVGDYVDTVTITLTY